MTIEHAVTQASTNIYAMMDNLPASIYFKNREGIYLDINATALQLMIDKGFVAESDKKEIIGKSDFDLFNDDVADSFRTNDSHVLVSGKECCLEEQNISPNGEIIKHISIKKPMYDNAHQPFGILGITLMTNPIKKISDHPLVSTANLTLREQECLHHYLQGKTSKETAHILNLSHRTIEEYFISIKRKFHCKNKRDLLQLNIM